MFRIHFTVRHCNRYNHTVPHVMIPGHWSSAKYILSVTLSVLPLLSFLHLIISFIRFYFYFCYLSRFFFCLLISHIFSFIFSFISSLRLILLSRCAVISISFLCSIDVLFFYILHVSFFLPPIFPLSALTLCSSVLPLPLSVPLISDFFSLLIPVFYLSDPFKFSFLRFFLLCFFFF